MADMLTDNDGNIQATSPQTASGSPIARVHLRILSPGQGIPETIDIRDIPVETTIAALKNRITLVAPSHPIPESQRLIYQGHVLANNDATLREIFGPSVLTDSPTFAIHLVARQRTGTDSSRPSSRNSPRPIRRPTPTHQPPNAASIETTGQAPQAPPPHIAQYPPMMLPGMLHFHGLPGSQGGPQQIPVSTGVPQPIQIPMGGPQQTQPQSMHAHPQQIFAQQAFAHRHPQAYPLPPHVHAQFPFAHMHMPQQPPQPLPQQPIDQQPTDAANAATGAPESASQTSDSNPHPHTNPAQPGVPAHPALVPDGTRYQMFAGQFPAGMGPYGPTPINPFAHMQQMAGPGLPQVMMHQPGMPPGTQRVVHHTQTIVHGPSAPAVHPVHPSTSAPTLSPFSIPGTPGHRIPVEAVQLLRPSTADITSSATAQTQHNAALASNGNVSTVYLVNSPSGPHAVLYRHENVFGSSFFQAPTRVMSRTSSHRPRFSPVLAESAGPADPAAVAPLNQANAPAAPAAPNEQGARANEPDVLAPLQPLLRQIWLLLRVLFFAYFFLGSSMGWHRYGLLLAICVVFYGLRDANVGQGLRDGIRGWWEGVVGVGNAQPRAAAETPQSGTGAPSDGLPAQGQAQLPGQQQDVPPAQAQQGSFGPLRAHLRPIERALALFIASLWPGIGEQTVRARRAAQERLQLEQRQREEAAAALQVEANAETGQADAAQDNPSTVDDKALSKATGAEIVDDAGANLRERHQETAHVEATN